MPDGYMNPQYGALMSGASEGAEKGSKPTHGKKPGGHKPPHVYIHSHGAGHTVHAFHHDGTHTSQDFADPQGAADHVKALLTGEGAAPEGHESTDLGGVNEGEPGER